MYFADTLDTASALATLGVPGLIVIILALVSVVVWQNKKIDKIYDNRLDDMKEIANQYGQFATQISLLIQKITDSTHDGSRRR